MVVTTGEETQTDDSPDIVRTARAREIYSRLPMSFEPNRGQADPTIRFLTRGPGYTLSFAAGEVAFTASQVGQDAKTDQVDTPEPHPRWTSSYGCSLSSRIRLRT
jgi:hypothetical protein